jgi:hypothetical protein
MSLNTVTKLSTKVKNTITWVSDNMHVLGDRFLRAMIGVENGDLIRKE